MPYTEAQKQSCYKWVEKNRERVKEYQRIYACYLDADIKKGYYEKKKNIIQKRNLDRYYYKKECERLRGILI